MNPLIRINIRFLLLFLAQINVGSAIATPNDPVRNNAPAPNTAAANTAPATDTLWRLPADTAHHRSARRQALDLIKNTKLPDSSIHWPNIRKDLFIENLIANIDYPLKIYQGVNTNFCGYAALSYLPLQDDPVKYTTFMMELYLNGKANWNNITFDPSKTIHNAAGTLRFKGILDIRPADQLWFLMLADHFRSYLNFFTRRFHPGSEDTFWAACNYGKFNRMIRQMLGWKVEAHGSDLIRAHVPNLFDYLTKSLRSGGTTYLYVNNTYLHKKNHNKFRTSLPTHYIVLESISRLPGDGDRVDIVYWDYGGRTLRQVDLRFLKRIIFGVSHCTPPQNS
jgi:hypothetical protein